MIYISITFHPLASFFERGQALFLMVFCFSWSSVSDDLVFSSCIFLFSFFLFLFRVLSSAFLSSVLPSLKLCLLKFLISEHLMLLVIHAKAAVAYSRCE